LDCFRGQELKSLSAEAIKRFRGLEAESISFDWSAHNRTAREISR
jgi:hypothetical protein